MATANVPIVTSPATTPADLDLSSIETADNRADITQVADKGDGTADIVYTLVPMADGHPNRLRRQLKNSALFDNAAWTAMSGSAKADFLRTVLKNIVRFILRGDA